MSTQAAVPGGAWRALPGMKLRAWPGEDVAAVWVPGSVNTHLVSALAADVLAAASHGGCSVQSITDVLLADDTADAMPPQDALATVAEVVAGLVQAGLLRQLPAPGRC